MNAIVVVDKKWGIGKNNDLLFKLPEDMKYFRQKTLNKMQKSKLMTVMATN